jgi:hypothetical protein
VTYLARYLRSGSVKHGRLVAYDGARVPFTCRTRHAEADGVRPGIQPMTLPVADFLQRWLLHVPMPQTRVVRSYGLYHPSHAAALAVCRAALGQPPLEAPAALTGVVCLAVAPWWPGAGRDAVWGGAAG